MMANTISGKLTNGLQRKQRSALSFLYNKYAASIYGIIKASVPDEEAAKHVLIKCFCSAWDTSSDYDPSRMRFFTWLFQLAKAEVEKYNESIHIPTHCDGNNLTVLSITKLNLK